ncbi:hypothetical protein NliqN6_1422 [Naganishia liquefaciens]|uniref:Dehydrin n=1 Tax=Naganishia liquefaciens TaxID=104408 RepID=A0A8H3TR07_9TREE|nr:hypothetical protein NliqN6_1422 [Naganishia liquefaciens]
MGAFDEPATYHSGENNSTTGREPFEDTSRDFIHGGNNTHAPGTGLPGTFGAGVGNTGSTTTSHHTGTGLTGGAAGAGLTGTHDKSHKLGRRGSASSSSSSSSEEEVDGVRRKKLNRTKKDKKPVGEKVKEAVGMGGAGVGVAGTHGKHESATGHNLTGASHGASGLHGERDAYNEGVPTRGDIRTGTSADPAVGGATGIGGIAGHRQTGDEPGGIQSGNTHFGTGRNLAAEAHDKVTGTHHTGTGLGSEGHYGSNTAASNYASTTEHPSGLGHSGSHTGNDRSAGFARDSGNPGNQGVAGSNLSGAAGTDRFDVDRNASGVNTGYGHDDAHKHQDTGISRHGPTGDFDNNATSTGGAYDNPDAKTGLTGREHTTTGVPDQHGNATHTGHGEAHSSGGLMDKVKSVLGGHK